MGVETGGMQLQSEAGADVCLCIVLHVFPGVCDPHLKHQNLFLQSKTGREGQMVKVQRRNTGWVLPSQPAQTTQGFVDLSALGMVHDSQQ